MKQIILTCMLLALPNAFAETEVVPLAIENGYWESNSELVFNKQMDDMLASLPENQRGAMKTMIEKSAVIPMVKTCVTEDSYKDFDKQFKESMGKQDDCEMTLKENTSELFVGKYECEEVTATFSVQVVNSKHHVTEVVTSAGGEVQSEIKIVAEWKGADCPADAIR